MFQGNKSPELNLGSGWDYYIILETFYKKKQYYQSLILGQKILLLSIYNTPKKISITTTLPALLHYR